MDGYHYSEPRAVGLPHDLLRRAGRDAACDLVKDGMFSGTTRHLANTRHSGSAQPEVVFDVLAEFMESLGGFIVSLPTAAYLERARIEGRCIIYSDGMDILDLVDAGPISRLRDLTMVFGHAVLHPPRHDKPVRVDLEGIAPAIEEAASWADGFLAVLLPHILTPDGQIIDRRYALAL